ncbi:MAG: acetate--CoA ligase family protein [Pseudomonadota bacterium]
MVSHSNTAVLRIDLAARLAAGERLLDETHAKRLLAEHGVPVPRGMTFVDEDELDAALAALSPPLVLKVMADDLAHKSDVGGVHLNLIDRQAVADAMRASADVPGRTAWLLEEMAPSGHEMVVGGVRHPRFGPMLLVGLGGTLVEVFDDVALGICPVSRGDCEAMLDTLTTAPLLAGVRGGAPLARGALVDLMLAVGGDDGLLVRHADKIAELDINPVIVSTEGACAVDALIRLEAPAAERASAPVTTLDALLKPRAVAIAGASATRPAQANQFIRNLRAYGYDGPMYAIHPSATEVDGLPAFPDFAALPEPVDYAYVSVAAARCPALLETAQGQVAFAQVMSGGFGEAGSSRALETELLDAAWRGRVRVLGPNCMGTHSPLGKLTYMSGVDPTPGTVSIVAQSGGLSSDILRRGAQRGLKFRSLVTVGNCADVGPAELSHALMDDDGTRVLGFYIEDARRGRTLFETLRANRGRKPVAILVGGITSQGSRAATSHTGALAGDARAWSALARQCGVALTYSLDEFLDVLLAMQQLAPREGRVTREVVLLGNGGGTSVLAADAFGHQQFNVSPLPDAAQAALEALDLPQGASVANPIDAPANAMARENGAVARRIVDGVFEHAFADAFVIHMNVPVILGYSHADILGQLMAATLENRAAGVSDAHVVLVLRSDGEPDIEALKADLRTRALDAGLPVYNELVDAARGLAGFSVYEKAALNQAGP